MHFLNHFWLHDNVIMLLTDFFQMKIGRRAMGALSVRYGTTYVTGNIAEAICKYFKIAQV